LEEVKSKSVPPGMHPGTLVIETKKKLDRFDKEGYSPRGELLHVEFCTFQMGLQKNRAAAVMGQPHLVNRFLTREAGKFHDRADKVHQIAISVGYQHKAVFR
jgi:hypothetical protein